MTMQIPKYLIRFMLVEQRANHSWDNGASEDFVISDVTFQSQRINFQADLLL